MAVSDSEWCFDGCLFRLIDLPAHEETAVPNREHIIAMQLSPAANVTWEEGTREVTSELKSGEISVIPQFEASRYRTTAVRLAVLRLPPLVLSVQELRPVKGFADPQLAAIFSALVAECEQGCPTGPLFGELLVRSLCVRVAERFAFPGLATTRVVSGGLARQTLRQLLSYLRANLDQKITLGELARVAGLSPNHLCTAFRQSTGLTLHGYLTELRIAEAKALLRNRKADLLSISHAVGFSNQAHFSSVFRKRTGWSPLRFRQELD